MYIYLDPYTYIYLYILGIVIHTSTSKSIKTHIYIYAHRFFLRSTITRNDGGCRRSRSAGLERIAELHKTAARHESDL